MAVDTQTLVALGSTASGVVSLGVAAVAWRHRDRPAAVPFGWLMVAVSGWCLFTAAGVLTGDAGQAYLFDRLTRLSEAHVAPLLLVFVLAYTGHAEWLTRRWIGLLWVYPTVFCLLVVTAPWHGLSAGPSDVVILTVGGITVPYVPEMRAEVFQAVLAYLTLFLSFAVLFRFVLYARSTYHRQALAIGIGAFVPVAANSAFQLGVRLHPGINLTPVTFVLSGLVMGWALFRYDFLERTPVATDVLVEELPDPVLVLDQDDRLVDHNAATERTFDRSVVTGVHVEEVVPELLDHVDTEGMYSLPGSTTADGGRMQFYDVQVTGIEDQHGVERGRLVVLRDVTGQQRRQDRLEALQSATQRFIAAGTDEEIADLAVDFASRVLDQYAAGVYLYDGDEDVLRPAALSDSVGRHFESDELVVEDAESIVWQTYEDGSLREVDVSEDPEIEPFGKLLLVPVGDRGVLGIGSRVTDTFPQEDQQFATILARTTQVALAQAERERELRQSRASVERRSEQIEFFNGVLRHTLRNALLVIQGRAAFLRDHVDDGQTEHVDRIVQWCEDLADLTEEIRAINDTVTATESERLDSVDLSALVRARAGAVDAEFDEAELHVDVHDALVVQANELVDQVIDSIVRNAARHNDRPDPRIEITTRRVADRVQVLVADNGPGISDELKETVFERDVATSQTSHGFGLYFVSVVMNLYGGTVWFEDNEPRGAVAVLEFQVATAATTEAQGTSGFE